MTATGAEVLGGADAGRVLTVFCDDVAIGRQAIRQAAEDLEPAPTLVELRWEAAPSLANELDEIRDALADAAFALWPSWYTTTEQRFADASSTSLEVEQVIRDVATLTPHVSITWLRTAWDLCRQQRLPLDSNMVSAFQVQQLARALDPRRLILALSVRTSDTSPPRVLGLARAAEWLARESAAKTILLLPTNWQHRTELDHVSYGSMSLSIEEHAPVSHDLPDLPSITPASTATAVHNGALPDTVPSVSVGPICGKPHPKSDVEQAVYAQLATDELLSPLFEYNQRLAGFGGKHYIVDLLWRSGRLVVELDGPEHHTPLNYVRDRDRDYRLMMNGYTVLRVSNSEVYVSVEAAIEKIKNIVGRLKPSPNASRRSRK